MRSCEGMAPQKVHHATSRWLLSLQIRKLEFLLAQAKLKGCDSIVTIGGAQGNTCVAQAMAARSA